MDCLSAVISTETMAVCLSQLSYVAAMNGLLRLSLLPLWLATLEFCRARPDLRSAALKGCIAIRKAFCTKETFIQVPPPPLSAALFSFSTERVQQLFRQADTQAKSVSFLLGCNEAIKRKSTSSQSRCPGCQTIGESHSGDMEMLWRGE